MKSFGHKRSSAYIQTSDDDSAFAVIKTLIKVLLDLQMMFKTSYNVCSLLFNSLCITEYVFLIVVICLRGSVKSCC